MANLTQLRLAAREIFQEALRDVDAGDAVRRAVRLDGTQLRISGASFGFADRNVFSIAIGKAALSMSAALEETLGEKLSAGLVAGPSTSPGLTKPDAIKLDARWRCFAGGHPVPNEESLRAASTALDLLESANEERALIVFLISGGGSAMIESPVSEVITLADLRVATKALVTSSGSIAEINAVRRAFSAVKGGRLAAKAPNCDQITLIVSDVPVGEEWNVASGPTLPLPQEAPDPLDVLARYDLRGQIPAAVLRAIEAHSKVPDPSAGDSTKLREHFVLLDNNDALEAAASAALRRGYTVEFARDITDGPIGVGCENLLARLTKLRQSTERIIGAGLCVISGGEFVCPVRGEGIGGRNLESALRLALAASSDNFATRDFVALCAGTDGIDGNSPAAGAMVDSTTIERARKIGLEAEDFLNRSDAYSFFVALGDAITTGPTGTNVRDLRILLASNSI
jgi:glycerate 2-kinase